MEDEADIPRPLLVVPYKVLISRWSLLLRIAGKHTLQAHTYTLYVMDRRPTRTVEQVKANDAIRINVWVPRDGMSFVAKEHYFGSFDGILGTETELQSVGLALVDGVGVDDLDVHEPGLEVISLNKRNAWW